MLQPKAEGLESSAHLRPALADGVQFSCTPIKCHINVMRIPACSNDSAMEFNEIHDLAFDC